MKKYSFTLLLSGALFSVQAQNLNGLVQANTAGIQGMFYNPASIVQNRHSVSVNLFTVSAGANNNLIKFRRDSVLSGNYSVSTIVPNTGRLNIVAPYLETHFPSAYARIKQRYAIGVSSRLRVFNGVHNADIGLYNAFKGANKPTSINDPSGFSWNTQVISDIGITGAAKLVDNDVFSLAAGLSLRLYRGASYFNISNNGIVGNYVNQPDTLSDYIQVQKLDLEISAATPNGGLLTADSFSVNDIFSTMFGKKAAGKGFGVDLGAELCLKAPAASQKPYLLRGGWSITDMGSLSYPNATRLQVKGAGTLYIDSISESEDIKEIQASLKRQGFTADTFNTQTKAGLPTLMNLYADYCVHPLFYVSASWFQGLRSARAVGAHYYSKFSVAPRLEWKFITFALPLTYHTLSKDLKVGAGLRIGPVSIGSEDLGLALGQSKGGNIYFGIAASFKGKKERRAQKEDKKMEEAK